MTLSIKKLWPGRVTTSDQGPRCDTCPVHNQQQQDKAGTTILQHRPTHGGDHFDSLDNVRRRTFQAQELRSKPKLRQSVSLPVNSQNSFFNQSKSNSRKESKVDFLNRPLPRLPLDNNNFLEIQLRKTSEGGGGRFRRKELSRRKTVHNFVSFPVWMSDTDDNNDPIVDHIYEEINEEQQQLFDWEKEFEERSFLSLISSGRRQNLKFYGCTDWDFGSEVI